MLGFAYHNSTAHLLLLTHNNIDLWPYTLLKSRMFFPKPMRLCRFGASVVRREDPRQQQGALSRGGKWMEPGIS